MFGSIQISFICFFYTSSFWTTITFPFTFTLLRPPFSKRSMSWTWCEMVLSWTSTQPPLRIFLLDLLPEDPDDWWLWDWLWVWVFRVDAKNVEISNINHWELEVVSHNYWIGSNWAEKRAEMKQNFSHFTHQLQLLEKSVTNPNNNLFTKLATLCKTY